MRRYWPFILLIFVVGCSFTRDFTMTMKAREIESLHVDGDADVVLRSNITFSIFQR